MPFTRLLHDRRIASRVLPVLGPVLESDISRLLKSRGLDAVRGDRLIAASHPFYRSAWSFARSSARPVERGADARELAHANTQPATGGRRHGSGFHSVATTIAEREGSIKLGMEPLAVLATSPARSAPA